VAAAILGQVQTQLLTLTGAGGSGKTRLALAVADDVRAAFDDGVAFVDLPPVVDPEQVVPAIASALGIKESGSWTLLEAVTAALRDGSHLLVLDNFEQVLPATASRSCSKPVPDSSCW
jgi:predicted ATPase